MQRPVTLQVLVGFESLKEILLTSKGFSEKQIVRFELPWRRRKLLLHLLSRPCKRRLKTLQCLKLTFQKGRDP